MSVCFIACSVFLAPSPVAVVGLGDVESQVDFSFYYFSQLDFSLYDFFQFDFSLNDFSQFYFSLLLADVPVLYTNTFMIQYTVYTLSGTVCTLFFILYNVQCNLVEVRSNRLAKMS